MPRYSVSRRCPPGCSCGRHGPAHNRLPLAEVTVRQRHTRIVLLRGKAADYLCGGLCGGRARDWAQIHGTSGLDPKRDYLPMCRRCHIRYDVDARWSPAQRAAQAARTRGERSTKARLTEADVRLIRTRRAAGETLPALALSYRVTKQTVHAIVHRRSWAHVA
jgi:hypothetical protein